MKSTLRHLVFALPLLVCTLAIVTHAQSTTNCTAGSTNGCLPNPLSSNLSSVPAFLSAAFTGLVKVSLPIITVFIVYSGFLFVTAQGNQEKLRVAKTNFFFVLLGALLILSAWILANIIGGTVANLTTGT